LVDRLIFSSQPGERNVFERGCLHALADWIDAHILPISGVGGTVAIFQVIVHFLSGVTLCFKA
jgi:hypothetical protein